MNIIIPKIPMPEKPKRKSVYAEHGDVTVFTSGTDNMCIRVKGLARVDMSKETKGAFGRGGADAYLKLQEAEQLYADLGKIIEELRERMK